MIMAVAMASLLWNAQSQPSEMQVAVGEPPRIVRPLLSSALRNRILDEAEAHYRARGLDTLAYPGADAAEMDLRIPEAARLVKEGRISDAVAAFEAQLRDAQSGGSSDQQVFEMLLAFGLSLERNDQPEASADYLRRAVAAARIAFGTDHSETAWTLTDFGLIVRSLNTHDSYVEAEAALAEAYAIRLSLYGENHPGRAAALRFLADTRASAFLLEGRPERIDEVATLYELATMPEPYEGTTHVYQRWARMYAQNRRPQDACRVLDRAAQDAQRLQLYVPEIALSVVDDLQANGWFTEAASVANAFWGIGARGHSECGRHAATVWRATSPDQP